MRTFGMNFRGRKPEPAVTLILLKGEGERPDENRIHHLGNLAVKKLNHRTGKMGRSVRDLFFRSRPWISVALPHAQGDGGLRPLVSSLLLLTILLCPAFSAPEEADQSDKVKALKIELEEQKQLRDRVIAKRWDDKRKYNESREKFNEEFEDLKDRLEQKSRKLERVRESVEYLRKDVEELKSRLENEKIQFMGLSFVQKGAVDEIARDLDKNFPLMIPERQAAVNRASKAADEKKDSPNEILDDVTALHLSEIRLSREISVGRKGVMLSDNSPGFGPVIRVGMAAAAYRDEKTGRTGIMLRSAYTSGKLFEWREDLTPSVKALLEKSMGQIAAGAAGGALPQMAVLPMDVLRTRMAGKGYTQGEKQNFKTAAVAYFEAGGIWMWPLGAIALVALLLLIERIIQWQISSSGSRSSAGRVLEMIRKGDVDGARKICSGKKRSAVLRAIGAVLENRGKSRDIAEKELQETVMRIVPALEQRLTTISVLGAAAPLLGLLGTVAGMIQLFESITLYGTSDPKLMAGGISVALITTETGLSIAVPILLLHNFMANRVDGLVSRMETSALKALNMLWPNG